MPRVSETPGHEALPRDARIIALILASKGIEDSSPQVLHQLLEFTHRYTTDILLDALTYSDHAGKNGKLELDDVELAVQAKVNYSFKEAGERDFLMPLAQSINSHPLPPVSETPFIKLPHPKHLLTAPNFNLVPNKPPAAYAISHPNGTTNLDDDDDELNFGGPIASGSGGGAGSALEPLDLSSTTFDPSAHPTADATSSSLFPDLPLQLQPSAGGAEKASTRMDTGEDDDYDQDAPGEDDEEEEEDEDDMMEAVELPSGGEAATSGGEGGVGTVLGEKRRMDDEDEDYDS